MENVFSILTPCFALGLVGEEHVETEKESGRRFIHGVCSHSLFLDDFCAYMYMVLTTSDFVRDIAFEGLTSFWTA